MSCKHTVHTSMCIPRLEVLYFVPRNGVFSHTPAGKAHVYQIPSVGPNQFIHVRHAYGTSSTPVSRTPILLCSASSFPRQDLAPHFGPPSQTPCSLARLLTAVPMHFVSLVTVADVK